MAYVQPNSVIELFKGVNLDNRYLHTIYFEANTATHKSAAEVQSDYFNGLSSKLTFNNLMFRRYGSNAIKIQINCQKLLDYTYMRFKNTRTFEEGTPVVDVDYSKWFYCFITGIDYVNENTSVIYYEIDVMQTWFIQDGTIEPCMVLREHVNDDTFGNNLEEEPCGSEVYDYDFITDCSNTDPNTHITDFGSYNLVAQSSGATDTDKHIIQGQFTGCKYYWHKCDSIGEANTAFAAIANNMLGGWSVNTQSEDLIDLYLVPAFCCPDDMDSPQQLDYHSPRVPENQQHAITRPTAYDSYTPKNNKLFMYPFSYLMLSTHKGDTAMYRWEYFDGQYPEFRYVGTMLGGGEINCYPLAYNGIANNFDAGLTMDNFPKCAYSFDAYQAWVAGGGLTRMEDERVVNSVKGGTAVFTAIGNIIRNYRKFRLRRKEYDY